MVLLVVILLIYKNYVNEWKYFYKNYVKQFKKLERQWTNKLPGWWSIRWRFISNALYKINKIVRNTLYNF